jgi:nitrate/nitrite transporter NarK
LATLAVLLLAYGFSQFFRAFLAVLAPELSADLGLSAADLGTISGAWFAAFALAQVPVGVALDRVGPRLTVGVLFLAAVIGTVLLALAQGLATAFLAMVLIGVGCAPVYMGMLYIVARAYPAAQFATFSSAIVGLGSLGNLVSATPLALAVDAFGWRSSLMGIAGLTALSALLVILAVRDPPRERTAGAGLGLAGLWEVMRIKALWPLLPLVATSYAVVAVVRGVWIGPYFAQVHELDAIARGHATTAMVVAMIVGALIYGPLDRLFGTRKWIVVIGTAIAAVALGVLAAVPVGVGAAAALFALVGAFGMTYGMLMAHARAFVPDHLVGRGITLMNLLFIGGAGVLQPISGRFLDGVRAAGAAPEAAFGALFGLYGATLAACLALYLVSQDRAPPRN